MDKAAIKNSIYQGKPVDLGRDEYIASGRSDLQAIAGEFIDAGDGLRGQIALTEVKRLDNKHKPFD